MGFTVTNGQGAPAQQITLNPQERANVNKCFQQLENGDHNFAQQAMQKYGSSGATQEQLFKLYKDTHKGQINTNGQLMTDDLLRGELCNFEQMHGIAYDRSQLQNYGNGRSFSKNQIGQFNSSSQMMG